MFNSLWVVKNGSLTRALHAINCDTCHGTGKDGEIVGDNERMWDCEDCDGEGLVLPKCRNCDESVDEALVDGDCKDCQEGLNDRNE